VADERVRLGFHSQNPVNLPPAHGVQVELPPGLRGIGPFGDLLVPDDGAVTDQVVDALVELAHHAATLLPPPAGDGPVTGPRTGCDQNENVF
jgi:hypothetical protein